LPGISEMIDAAAQQAPQRGMQRGLEQGLEMGEQRGVEKTVAALLGRLFARRVGRRPTTEEERAIVERADALGDAEVEDALLDLERDALLRWLSEPVHRP
jgi:flagellar biosynthesis/type III secretory pathway protein FliH